VFAKFQTCGGLDHEGSGGQPGLEGESDKKTETGQFFNHLDHH
jgi:hypothetical protein